LNLEDYSALKKVICRCLKNRVRQNVRKSVKKSLRPFEIVVVIRVQGNPAFLLILLAIKTGSARRPHSFKTGWRSPWRLPE